MMRFTTLVVLTILAGRLTCPSTPVSEPAPSVPEFKEVYDLIRGHLAGVSEAELNHAAVQGLISALGPRVTIETNSKVAPAHGSAPPAIKVVVFDGPIAYLQIGRVTEGLGEAIGLANQALSATNRLKGIVLDL